MVDWKKMASDAKDKVKVAASYIGEKAKDVASYTGEKAKEVSVAAGKQAGIGLSEEEKELKHKQKLKNLQQKAEMEEAKLSRQTANTELRTRISVAKKEFNENRPPSGFDRFKKTLDGMKTQAQAQQQKTVISKPTNIDRTTQTIRQEARPIKRKSTPTPGGMNFEQMLGMGSSSQGNFDDMLGGIKKNGKKSKRSSGASFDEMLGMGPRKKKGKKKGKKKKQ